MPKRLPPNNRPWPENMAFDLSLSPTITPVDAEAFIDALATSDRNKQFLLLRYREGRTYAEIAAEYGLTATGVRLAIKSLGEKFGGVQAAPPDPTVEGKPVVASPVSTPTETASPASPPPSVEEKRVAPPTDAAPPVEKVVPQSAATPTTAAPAVDTSARPLSLNLAAVRRFLGLTPEEFARPIPIEDGKSLITRLETGFSRASSTILDLLCEAWEINRKYLLAGRGEMFELQPYCDGLVSLLKKYLSVATFDRQGQQYWKGSLVDDLERLIDVGKLNGREMCRVVRTLYDYLDVEQFAELLERIGR